MDEAVYRSFRRLIPSLHDDDFDGILAGATLTTERR
jgi:ABC-type amino acid transport substrate-binding protein